MAGFERKRAGKPERIGALMPKAYPSNEPADVAAVRAFGWWRRVVPARIAEHARPVRLREGVLTVHAATSAWASDLDFAREQLLASVKRLAPEARVREIRIRVGPLPDAVQHREEPPPPEVIPLASLPDEIARALATVRDDGVRTAIDRAARTSLGTRVPPPKKKKR